MRVQGLVFYFNPNPDLVYWRENFIATTGQEPPYPFNTNYYQATATPVGSILMGLTPRVIYREVSWLPSYMDMDIEDAYRYSGHVIGPEGAILEEDDDFLTEEAAQEWAEREADAIAQLIFGYHTSYQQVSDEQMEVVSERVRNDLITETRRYDRSLERKPYARIENRLREVEGSAIEHPYILHLQALVALNQKLMELAWFIADSAISSKRVISNQRWVESSPGVRCHQTRKDLEQSLVVSTYDNDEYVSQTISGMTLEEVYSSLDWESKHAIRDFTDAYNTDSLRERGLSANPIGNCYMSDDELEEYSDLLLARLVAEANRRQAVSEADRFGVQRRWEQRLDVEPRGEQRAYTGHQRNFTDAPATMTAEDFDNWLEDVRTDGARIDSLLDSSDEPDLSGIVQGVFEVKTNFPEADFWLWRVNTVEKVGKPEREFNKNSIGIKVLDQSLFLPDYLYYKMLNIWHNKYWEERVIGSVQPSIRVRDVEEVLSDFLPIQAQPTNQALMIEEIKPAIREHGIIVIPAEEGLTPEQVTEVIQDIGYENISTVLPPPDDPLDDLPRIINQLESGTNAYLFASIPVFDEENQYLGMSMAILNPHRYGGNINQPISAEEMEDLLDQLRELGIDISSDDDLAGIGIKKDRKGLWLVGGAVLASLLIKR
jgi:hypothetical protein